MKLTLNEMFMCAAVVLGLLCVPSFYVGKAYFKAQSWNKINPEKPVTVWDAMWLDLRVTD